MPFLNSSCVSNDSNKEFIVGNWIVTQQIVAGNKVVSPCNSVIIHECTSDTSMSTYQAGYLPNGKICGVYGFGTYTWENIEAGHYVRNHRLIPNFKADYFIENNGLKSVFDNGIIA